MLSARVVLIGATGYTGRLVARELAAGGAPGAAGAPDTAADRAADHAPERAPYVLAGRDPGKLARLAQSLGGADTARVDVRDEASLARLIRGGDVVVSCAGPFTELGEPVVRACVEAGAHYADTTGEQAYMKRVLDAWDEPARAAGSVVVNALAFEYVLGDLAARLAAEGLETPLREVEIVYAWRVDRSGASRGTRRSMLRILAERGVVYRNGEWRPSRAAAERRAIELPDGTLRSAITFPSGEVLTVPRHVPVRDVRAWIVTGRWTSRLAHRLSPVLPTLARLATPLADRLLARAPAGPTPAERQASTFLISARARGGGGAARRVDVRGSDPYALTGAIAALGARRIRDLALDGGAPAGVRAPAEVLEPRPFLDALAERGVTWERASPGAA